MLEMADFNSREAGGSDNLHLLLKARGVRGAGWQQAESWHGSCDAEPSPLLVTHCLFPQALISPPSVPAAEDQSLWPLPVQLLTMFGAFILAAPNQDAAQLSPCCRWGRGAGVTLCVRPICSP